MSRIFIYDRSYDTINTLRHALEEQDNGHEIFANVVVDKGRATPKLVLHPVDVVGLLVGLRPFPDLIIAEAGTIDGCWLCGLVCDMELAHHCSIILTAHQHSDKIRQIQRLYGAHFWPKPFNVLGFVECIETYLTVSC